MQSKTFTTIIAGLRVTKTFKKTEAEKVRLKELKKNVENKKFTRFAKYSIL